MGDWVRGGERHMRRLKKIGLGKHSDRGSEAQARALEAPLMDRGR